ncbi:MAG: hypothetical protein HYW26_00880 [Candidatus Aenigmarchaeota archaeon]|nr:hypothetical protein [Candidatus Aenigmarchaeota archaeon]
MSAIDYVHLIKNLACLHCGKDGTTQTSWGPAGFGRFQTKSTVEPFGRRYTFPGVIPAEQLESYGGIHVSDLCLGCKTGEYRGVVFFDEDASDKMSIMMLSHIVLLPHESHVLEPKGNEFYQLAREDSCLRIDYNLEPCLNHHVRDNARCFRAATMYRRLLQEIADGHPQTPAGRIIELAERFTPQLKDVGKPVVNPERSKDGLRQVAAQIEPIGTAGLHYESAVTTLIFLSEGENPELARRILLKSGISEHRYNWEKTHHMKWYKGEVDPKDPVTAFSRVAGILGGPNMYLNELYEESKAPEIQVE